MVPFFFVCEVNSQFFFHLLNILQVCVLELQLLNPFSLATLDHLTHIKDSIPRSLVLKQFIPSKLVDRSEWTEESCQFLAHICFLFIDLQVIHHDLKHSILFLIVLYLPLKHLGMEFKLLRSILVHLKLVSLTASYLI